LDGLFQLKVDQIRPFLSAELAGLTDLKNGLPV